MQLPNHLEAYLGHEYVRRSLSIRSWEAPQEEVRRLEASSLFPEPVEQKLVTIEGAVKRFFEDVKARHLAEVTIKKLKIILEKQLLGFAQDKGLLYLNQLDVDVLREFRSTWNDSPISAVKKLERLR